MNKLVKVKAKIDEILKEHGLDLISDDPYCGVLLIDTETHEEIDM
ncbi:hypothetical protein LEO2_72 [Bacillus phage Leo2]|uniref:Uncharacterized protein n=1 Tax=Bacillus phage Leo2 TaxID=1815973 RepID=A0A1S5QTS1_9CAUD|nr:hypothetical protein LEO2_72 [Bacillus phage Leo2]